MCHLKALGESFQMIPFGSAWAENWRAESDLFFSCMVSFSLICIMREAREFFLEKGQNLWPRISYFLVKI